MKFFVLIFLFVQTTNAAFERTNQGSRAVAMGGSLVAATNNPWSAFTNPATLKSLEERTLSLLYAPQLFELRELSFSAVAFVEPTSFGTFGVSASRFGFELYKETRLGLSYSDAVADFFSLGVTVNYFGLAIKNYGSAGTIGVDLGGVLDVSDQVRWGFAAFNVTGARIGAAKEKLPQVFSTGLTYTPIPEATIAASIMKDVRYDAELRIGIEYMLMDLVALRAGSTNDPNTVNAGVGIHYAFAELDYAFSSHSELGISHQFSLSLTLGTF